MANGDCYNTYYTTPYDASRTVWGVWTTGTTTSANDATTAGDTWIQWQPAIQPAQYQYTIRASTTANNIWYQWAEWHEQGTATTQPQTIQLGVYPAPVQTKAEIRAAARAVAQRAKEAIRLQKQAERARKQHDLQTLRAERKAVRLLLALLNRQQKKEYAELKQITINHPGTEIPQFVLKNTLSGNILEHDKQGKPIMRHCVHVGYGIPLADNLATQLLYLQSKPEEMLKIANHTRIQ